MLPESRIQELSWKCDTKERAMNALRTAAREAAIAENEAGTCRACGRSKEQQIECTDERCMLLVDIRARREGL